MRIIISLCLFAACIAGLAPLAFAGPSPADVVIRETYRFPERTLEECCHLPAWWDEVQAPQIRSLGDLQQIWLDKELANSAKAKALFTAIRDFDGRDDEIVSRAINLYSHVDPGYADLTPLLEYGGRRFFDHERSLEGYSGKTGDTTAGLVLKLARRYEKDGRATDAAILIGNLVRDRSDEINDHLLELASISMADALVAMDRDGDAARILSNASSAYNGSWEKRIAEKQTDLRERMGLLSYGWAVLPMKYLLLGLVALIVAASAYRRMRPPSNLTFGRSATPS